MGKMKLLLDVIGDLRSLADSLQAVADATVEMVAHEVLSLKMQDLHLDLRKPYFSIIGKGHKRRMLYLMPKTVAHLKKYIAEYQRWIRIRTCFISEISAHLER